MAASANVIRQEWRDRLSRVGVPVLVALVALLVPMLLLRFPYYLVIGLVVGVIGLAIIVASPYIGLILFLGLIYVRPEDSFPALASMRMTLLVSLVAMFAWIINAFLCRERFSLHLPAVKSFVGFVVVASFSTAVCGSGRLGDEAMELMKLFVLFVLITHLVNTEKRLDGAVVALVVFSAYLGAHAIWDFQHGIALVQSDGSVRARASGIFADPNDLALTMAMAFPLALGIALSGARYRVWVRLLCVAAVPVFLWAIFLTNSRGGMLAFAATVALLFGQRWRGWGIALGVVACLLLFSLGPSRLSMMSAEDESSQGRVQAWISGIEMLQSSPVWGVGKGQFVEHHHRTAHNSLVLALAEVGYLGTMFWLGIFYFALRDRAVFARDQRARSLPALLQNSLITFWIGAFFLSRTYTTPLYVYLGFAIAAGQVSALKAGDESQTAATPRDWVRVALIALATIPLVMLLIRLWER